MEVSVKTSGAGKVLVEILDGDQVIVSREQETNGETAMDLEIPNAKLWSTESPDLYSCRVRYGNDEETVTFGIRSLEWGKKGILINGKRVIIRGACPYYETDMSYLDHVCDTYYGEALAVVQAGDGEQLAVTVSDGTYSARAYVTIE